MGKPYSAAIYEEAFTKALGVPHAFGFYKGRVALYAILKALEVSEGDRVIFPGFTCIMVPNAAVYLGAKPVYVDIDPMTLNMDPSKLEAALISMKASGIKKTRAIVVQHTFGVPADMDAVLGIAARYGIPVVEDCAHALGSRYKGRLCGTMGVASFFSSQWSKPYSTGLGGMAVTEDQLFARKLKLVQSGFSEPGMIESAMLAFQVYMHKALFSPRMYWTSMHALRALSSAGIFIGSSSGAEYRGELPGGYLKAIGEKQAEAGIEALSRIKKDIEHRKKVARFYDEALSPRRASMVIPFESDAVLLRYPVMVADKDAALRDARLRNAELGSWFESVLHPETRHLEKAGYIKGSCPAGEEAARHLVNLPTHPRTTAQDAKRSLSIVMKHLTRRNRAS
ncbi:MAG TPA: DegT/DnrJ/EryC1/StrS family aminotransferase [Nitrospirota bacterium]|jgi:dTDP-4-amino-4,6-dideoxygalactose transaminase